MTGKRRVAVAMAVALLLATAVFVLGGLAYRPNTGPDVFDNRAAFDRYVASLHLQSLALEQARARLDGQGFRCDLLAPGNLSCYRKAQGSDCGERQFVDLRWVNSGSAESGTVDPGAAQGHPEALRISTRFGLTCD